MLAVPGNSNLGSALTPLSGAQLIDGTLIQQILSNEFSTLDNITALAGGARSVLTPTLSAAINRVAVVASGNDSVVLPPALQGTKLLVQNDGANAMQVFGLGSDTINGTAGATGVSQASGKSALYFCPVNGKWFRNLSA